MMMEKKKVGIITYHAADNYGSVLQAYALSNYLKKDFNQKCTFINYCSESQRMLYGLYFANESLKDILKNLYIFLILKEKRETKIHAFDSFRRKYFQMSPLNPTSDVKELNLNRYDLIICGSDQIWNVRIKDYDSIYMLDGVDIPKKISYAASMGGLDLNLTNAEMNKIHDDLKSFFSISVRENIAKTMLSKCSLPSIRTNIDPTFLLPADDWKKIMSPRIIEDEYIFFYSIDYNDDSLEIAEWYGNKLGLPVIYMNTSWKSYFIKRAGMKWAGAVKVEDFLSLVYYSKAVLSGSFHGTAFSLIFNKPFYRIQRNVKGNGIVDDRVRSLFERLEIHDREISIDNYKIMLNGLFNIDYKTINQNIRKAKDESKSYFADIFIKEVENENRTN